MAPSWSLKGLWERPERLQELPKGAKIERVVARRRRETTFRDPWGLLGGYWGCLGSILGGSWEHFGDIGELFWTYFGAREASLKRFAEILKNHRKHSKVLQTSRVGGSQNR